MGPPPTSPDSSAVSKADPKLEPARDRRAPRRAPREPLIDDETPYEDDARARYVVANHPDGLPLTHIGELTDLTRERVRQIEERALAKAERAARAEGLSLANILGPAYQARIHGLRSGGLGE